MEKIHKSKVDIWLVILAISPIVILFSMWFRNESKEELITSASIGLILLLFFADLYFNTFYRIKDGKLFMKCGILFIKTIDIQLINKIMKSNSFESSPALSLDRIEIKYNEKPAVRYKFYDYVLVSPENKEEFIEDLLKINPNIEVEI